MFRLVACLAVLLSVGAFAAPLGQTRAIRPQALRGFRLWEGGPAGYTASRTPGNIRRTFFVRFKNETREEIAEVDVRLRVHQGTTTTYLSPVFRLSRFDNATSPHYGSILPFNKTIGRETFTVDYPERLWNTAAVDDIDIVALKAYSGPQDLRDTGHLFTFVANSPDATILQRFAKEPALLKTHDAIGMNPTLIAFAVGRPAVVKYVLAHGGDLRSRTKGGSTVAHLAAFNTYPGILDLLLAKHVPLDAPTNNGRTPLIKAIQVGNVAAVRWLLKHGSNPNVIDKDGRGPVYYSIVEGQTQAFEALVQGGANRGFHNRNGWGWMHTAAIHNYLMLPYVLRAGVAVNDADPRFGFTPLMAAAQGGGYDAVPWLIAHGARPDAKDKRGMNAYDYSRGANTLGTDRFFREAVENATH